MIAYLGKLISGNISWYYSFFFISRSYNFILDGTSIANNTRKHIIWEKTTEEDPQDK